jgi:hypothetical protein
MFAFFEKKYFLPGLWSSGTGTQGVGGVKTVEGCWLRVERLPAPEESGAVSDVSAELSVRSYGFSCGFYRIRSVFYRIGTSFYPLATVYYRTNSSFYRLLPHIIASYRIMSFRRWNGGVLECCGKWGAGVLEYWRERRECGLRTYAGKNTGFYAMFHESPRKFAQIRAVVTRCYAFLRVGAFF